MLAPLVTWRGLYPTPLQICGFNWEHYDQLHSPRIVLFVPSSSVSPGSCELTHPLRPVLSIFKHSTSAFDQRLRTLAWALLWWGVIVMIVSLSLNICASYSSLENLGENESLIFDYLCYVQGTSSRSRQKCIVWMFWERWEGSI